MLGEIESRNEDHMSNIFINEVGACTFELKDESRNGRNGGTYHMWTCTSQSTSDHRHELLDISRCIFSAIFVHAINHAPFYDASATHLMTHGNNNFESSCPSFF